MLIPVEKVESSLSTPIRPRYVAGGRFIELTAVSIMGWTVVPCAAIVLLFATSEQTGAQQTIVTSTAGIVVVLIPGFPVESILLGLLAGFIAVLLVRLRRRHWAASMDV